MWWLYYWEDGKLTKASFKKADQAAAWWDDRWFMGDCRQGDWVCLRHPGGWLSPPQSPAMQLAIAAVDAEWQEAA